MLQTLEAVLFLTVVDMNASIQPLTLGKSQSLLHSNRAAANDDVNHTLS